MACLSSSDSSDYCLLLHHVLGRVYHGRPAEYDSNASCPAHQGEAAMALGALGDLRLLMGIFKELINWRSLTGWGKLNRESLLWGPI